MSRKSAEKVSSSIANESRFRIVLVRPEGDANIGAVCRAMKTMGFDSLSLVLPDRREPEPDTVKTWALHAFDLFTRAGRYESLEDALADSGFSVGFTRRIGARRKGREYDLEELAPELARRAAGAGEEIALVFGNEADGLNGAELAACSIAAGIDTHPGFPSLNLSHAVQVVCYTLRLALKNGTPAGGSPPDGMSRTQRDRGAAEIIEALRGIGFFTLGDSSYLQRFFRDLMERADLTEEETEYFRGLFDKIRNLKIHRP